MVKFIRQIRQLELRNMNPLPISAKLIISRKLFLFTTLHFKRVEKYFLRAENIVYDLQDVKQEMRC